MPCRVRIVHHAAWLTAVVLARAACAGGQEGPGYADLSLEELANIEITSVSKQAEPLAAAPASVYIITADEIRRSGSRSLPEALRLAPNLQVARVRSGTYAISARGFNNAIGNKLLVLIDGRTVYTPLFSGVNWDTQFVMLEDVERIEVISGPGATLWGANAVNGVINVITRRATQTSGWLAAGSVGNRADGLDLRYGAALGADGAVRVYATGLRREHTVQGNGLPQKDGWTSGQLGFRADWARGRDAFTVQGDRYRATSDDGPLGPVRNSGANLLARWSRALDQGGELRVQAYLDQVRRDDPLVLNDAVETADLELSHAFSPGAGHKILWGAGYRHAHDEVESHRTAFSPFVWVFAPARRSLQWRNLFAQDEIALTPALSATLGLKAETNIYTGLEYLPSARLAWKTDAFGLVWGALSRAVRAPARLDREFQLFSEPPGRAPIPIIKGGPDFVSEVAQVAELGYRAQPSARLSWAVTGYYSDYDKLRSGQRPPASVQNMMYGSTWGVEAWGSYQAAPDWRLGASLVTLHEDIKLRPGSLDPTGPSALGNDPRLQWSLRSSWNFLGSGTLDLALRHVGPLPKPAVPAYTALDLRLAWRLRRGLEVALSGQNLCGTAHREFGPADSGSVIPAAVAVQLVWTP